MKEYRQIVPSFWTDPDIKRQLTLEQKALLIYLITSPHSNMIGLYYLPLEYASAETGLEVKTIRGHLAGALVGFGTYDEETEEVFVHNMARYQIADELKGGDKRKKSVERLLTGIHSGRLRREFLTRYSNWGLIVPASVGEAPSEGGSEAPSEGAAQAPPHAIAVTRAVTGAGTATDSDHRSPAGADTRTADASHRPAISPPDTSGGGWPAEFTAMFEAIGQFAQGRVGKAIKPVVERYSLDRAREMLAAFVQLGPHQRADGTFDPDVQAHQFCTPERFAQTAAFWYRQTEPLADTVRV
jgi:hypothetical protein